MKQFLMETKLNKLCIILLFSYFFLFHSHMHTENGLSHPASGPSVKLKKVNPLSTLNTKLESTPKIRDLTQLS